MRQTSLKGFSIIRIKKSIRLILAEQFGDYPHLVYPKEPEVKDTADIQMSASCLDLHLEIHNGEKRFLISVYCTLFILDCFFSSL